MQVHMKAGQDSKLKLTVREYDAFLLVKDQLTLIEQGAPLPIREAARDAKAALEKLMVSMPAPIRKSKAAAPPAEKTEQSETASGNGAPVDPPPAPETPPVKPAKRQVKNERGQELPQQELPF